MKTAAMARRVHAREEDGGDDEGGVSTVSGEEEDGVDGDRGDTFVHTLTGRTTSSFRWEGRFPRPRQGEWYTRGRRTAGDDEDGVPIASGEEEHCGDRRR